MPSKPPPTDRGRRLRYVLWALAVVSLLYAPIAMTDLWRYRFGSVPSIGEWLLGHAVTPSYVSHALAGRLGPYRHSFVAMVVHSVLGGALMIIGPAQLLSAWRRRRRTHRRGGLAYASLVYVSMAGAGIYLARTPSAEVFSGPVFAIALGAIGLGTVTSVTAGIIEVRQGHVQSHQRFMTLSYGYLMTAPLLRLQWATLPLLLPGLSLAAINRIAIMNMGGIVAFAAFALSRSFDPRGSLPGARHDWVRPWQLGAASVVAAVILLWSGAVIVAGRDHGRAELLGFAVPYLACAAAATCFWRRAEAAGRRWPAEEWRLQLLVLAAVPAFAVFTSAFFGAAFGLSRADALESGYVVAWGALSLLGVAVVAARQLIAAARTEPSPAPLSTSVGV